MALKTEDEITQVVNSFNEAGFETITCDINPNRYCFDILASNSQNETILTKVVNNIDSISEKNVQEMKVISYFINSVPILIGNSNRRSDLDENTIYFRFNIPAINLSTLRNMLLNNILPYIIAKRGSYISYINGSLIRSSRENLNLSRKDLSDKLNVSIKTISTYERGITKSNITNVKNLEEILKIDIKVPLNIMKSRKFDITEKDLKANKPTSKDDNSGFYDFLSELFEEWGMEQYWPSKNKSPFDLFLMDKDSIKNVNNLKSPLLSSIFTSINKNEEVRLSLIKKVLNALKISGAVIVEDHDAAKICSYSRVPVIEKKELKEVSNQKEFSKLVKKKAN